MKTFVALLALVFCMLCLATARSAFRRPVHRTINGAIDTQKRIINGRRASFWRLPFQAFIVGQDKEEFCGGTVLGNEWVLTSAQCVYGGHPEDLTVTVGMKRRNEMSPNQKDYKVKKIIVHEQYNDQTMDNDIALLQLKTKVVATSSSRSKNIHLPKQGDNIAVGTKCYFFGWGSTTPEKSFPNQIKVADMPIVSAQTCKQMYSDMDMNINPKTMLCAGGNDKTGCQGDKGGPLICVESRQYVLRGFGSQGHPSCDPRYYTVFTRVSSFFDWIQIKMYGYPTE